MSEPELTLAHECAAALAWWQAAGVDYDYADDATAWLAAPPAVLSPQDQTSAGTGRAGSQKAAGQTGQNAQLRAMPVSPSQPPDTLRHDYLGESPPRDLAAFRAWWMTAPGIDTARAHPRIAPRGSEAAALMILVPQPEQADRDTLLSDAQGRLLANILQAMGMDDSAIYFAAALPCHTPMADLAALAAGGMDRVTAHHIALVRPARLLAFGTGLGPMLETASDHPLREINHPGGKVPVIVSETLDALMEMPRLKARLWRRWMEWSPTL